MPPSPMNRQQQKEHQLVAAEAAVRSEVGKMSSVFQLQQQMHRAQTDREHIKALLEDVRILVSTHTSQKALGNVTDAREIEILRAMTARRQEDAKLLRRDIEVATREHERLQAVNEKLLQGLQEKNREKQQVIGRLEAHDKCERNLEGIYTFTRTRNDIIGARKDKMGEVSVHMLGKMGGHHAEVMRLEQTMLDLRLEVDSLRGKLGRAPVGSTFTNSYVPYLGPCDNPECARTRRQCREARLRLLALQEATVAKRNSVSSQAFQP